MSEPDKDSLRAIEALEHNLYTPKPKKVEATAHTIHSDTSFDVPETWGSDSSVITPFTKEQPGHSFGTKMLLIASAILCLTLIFTAWRVLSSRNVVSSENIDVVIDGKPYVEGGESTPFAISVLNRNTVSLQDAVLTVSYEKGAGIQDEQQKVYEKRSLGTIASNALRKEEIPVVVYGKEADARTITVKLDYKVAGANAVFNKVIMTSVILKTPPIAVDVDGPITLVQGQVATFTVRVKNNTTRDLVDNLVALSLPTTFTVQSVEPKPAARGYVWNINSLSPGETQTITVKGVFTSQPQESVTLKASVGAPSGSLNDIGVVYAEESHTVAITSPLLLLSTSLETDRGAVQNLRYGDKATVLVSYTNKSSQVLRDVSVIARISGTAALYGQISAEGGYYDSVEKTITFSRATNPELTALAPGATGVFKVFIPVVARGTNSPVLSVTSEGLASVSSKNDTTSAVTKTWIVQGSATLNAWTTYKNAPFANTGPLPPTANMNTTYSVHISASAQNSLSLARVSFVLPAYVTWTGVYGKDTTVAYDSRTRTVVWSIGAIPAGQTVANDIQVSVRPSQSHVGNLPSITSGITLEADETDSKARIRTAIAALTTELTRDSSPVDISHVVGGQ